MIKRLVIWLARKKLKLGVYDLFMFANQKTEDVYYFTHTELRKITEAGEDRQSNVSLNWLLGKECDIVRVTV